MCAASLIILLSNSLPAWGLFLVIAIYSYGFRNIYYRFLDRRQNAVFSKNGEFTRQAISDNFYKLKTTEGRLEFVNKLSNLENPPTGSWKDKLPNVSNDEASIRLAQLEESWLNLDR
jgi:hypothetical protein